MRWALTILVLLVFAPAAAADCTPPTAPGFKVSVCDGGATVSGGERLRDVRVTGNGHSATIYVARLDLDGLLMEATLGPAELPEGVPLRVGLRFDGAVLERDAHPDDVVVAPVRARRAFRSPETPLSETAAPRVSDACFAFRREVMPHQYSSSLLRQLRVFRAARTRLANRLWATGNRTVLPPIVRSLRAGNRHLLTAERVLRRTDDFARTMRALRAYDRVYRREARLLRELRMGECGSG